MAAVVGLCSSSSRPPGALPSSLLGYEALTGSLDDSRFEDYLHSYDHRRQVFSTQMGLSNQDIVALFGGHTLVGGIRELLSGEKEGLLQLPRDKALLSYPSFCPLIDKYVAVYISLILVICSGSVYVNLGGCNKYLSALCFVIFFSLEWFI
ncbi:L-ascorbate peroxidase 2 cytosolic [Zea mays]|uniref:L-ascorbate peroxidase 2 cytosolic n=1 Tax=Zea mays TaxID=4577 RepID=A0A1D6HWB8_MAIZE|nr:L-ascorbate peroxidase 2 cytosolic [Zea mays]